VEHVLLVIALQITSYKNTLNANFTKMWLKQAFLKLVIIVIWSKTHTFYFFLFVFHLEKSFGFVSKKIIITQT